MMPICKICSSAITKLGPQHQSSMLNNSDVQVTFPRLESTIINCWICSQFATWLRTEHPEWFNVWHREELHVKYAMPGVAVVRKPQYCPTFLVMMDLTVEGYEHEVDACRIDLNVVPAQDFTTYPFKPLVRSPDLSIPIEWIENCKKNHSICNGEDSSWYPTRLLYFGDNNEMVKLVLSKDHHFKGPYVTLSHRWGPHMKLKLTSSNMPQLQDGIKITSLAKVFQESIKIARTMEIYYIWIDALCIQQDEDDLSDWVVESKMMNKVYSSAFLNISAALSSDGKESLFCERDTSAISLSTIELDIDNTSHGYYVMDSNIWQDEIDNAPLNQRGWVFQERFSSRRLLHIGRQQLAWECRELATFETFPKGLPEISTASYLIKPRMYKTLTNLSKVSNGALDPKFASAWHLMVQNYSKCDFTFPKDKLVAFQGVTDAILKFRGGRCVAGVWEDNIACDLMWHRPLEANVSSPISETSFRAPSWSWASVDGEIWFTDISEKLSCFIIEAEIVEPIANESEALYKHALMRLCGTCTPFKINSSDGEISSFEVVGLRFSLEDTYDTQITIDGSEEEIESLSDAFELFLLPSLATSRCFCGIILTKVQGATNYRRVGAIEIPGFDGFSSDEIMGSELPSRDRVNLKTIELTKRIAKLPPMKISIC